jgi:hypothetical protein
LCQTNQELIKKRQAFGVWNYYLVPKYFLVEKHLALALISA